ncbi:MULTISPECIES: hypothetical protein [Roseomonadaceae]|uniref:Uncharacterized protein n=1 Tax=Falsiroseomonas oleicola TaxID=2801474 RepID=A0ABS6H9G6_9PROT|nr:hypothetical protein [Roseomonas oleicola]MBU8545016.1 hypothetical protein [Roseomonas oleicola]
MSITNFSGTTFKVTAVSPSSGKISDIAVGDVIGALSGATQVFSASSTSGSSGAAAGSVSIASEAASFVLQYQFKPNSSSGGCPCQASNPGGSRLQQGNYTVTAEAVAGQSNGQASIAWTINSGWA